MIGREMKRNWILLLLVSSGLMIGAASCHRGDAEAAGEKKPATTQAAEGDEGQKVKLDPKAIEKFHITVQEVDAHPWQPTFVAPARVGLNSEAMANVGPPVPGRVADIKVKLGDSVKKGDELLAIVSNDLGEGQSDYLLKRTNVAAATAAVEPTKTAYDRAKALFDKSEGISLSEVQKREAEWRAATAALASAKEALNASMRKLQLLGMSADAITALSDSGALEPRYVIRAPIAGQVIDRNVTLGQFVSPDKEPLLVLADLSTLWVIADVPQQQLKNVALGAEVRVTAAGGGDAIEGSVAYIAAAVDPATRTVQVRVTIKGGQASLRPGVAAEAEFDMPVAAGADPVISVPEEAVQTIDGKPSIFVPEQEAPNTFEKRVVIVGTPSKGRVPILFGVESKEKVVVTGAFILKAELGKPAAE